jgi:antitoxin MazE
MDLQVAKWGNSLALRIPSEVVRQLGLREGATVEAQLTVDGTLSIAIELTQARSSIPMSGPVLEEVRSSARY